MHSAHALRMTKRWTALLCGCLVWTACGVPLEETGDESLATASSALGPADRRSHVANTGVTGIGGVAVASWGGYRRDYFYVDATSLTLKHLWSTDRGVSVYGPEDLGGQFLQGTPAAVSWGFQRLDVVVKDSNGRLLHQAWDPSRFPGSHWQGLVFVPGLLFGGAKGSPALASWGPGRLDLFYRDLGSQLAHRWFEGGAWNAGAAENLGGYCMSDPSATSWGDHRLDIVVANTAAGISHRAYDWGWFGWDGIGLSDNDVQYPLQTPVIVSTGSGLLDVFWQRRIPGTAWVSHTTERMHFEGSGWTYRGGAWTQDHGGPPTFITGLGVRGYPEVNVVSTWSTQPLFAEERWFL